jgi:hypothetical protein
MLVLLRQAGEQLGMRLERLAREQAATARELDDLAAEPAAGALTARPSELAREAEELGRRMAGGTLDRETLVRQERLFRRLLDAGRSLEKENRDPSRREARTASRSRRRAIPELQPGLRSGLRYPYPGEAELRLVDPAYRKLVLDYFDRLNRRPAAAPPLGSDGDVAGDGIR